jgi:hypothetical protein
MTVERIAINVPADRAVARVDWHRAAEGVLGRRADRRWTSRPRGGAGCNPPNIWMSLHHPRRAPAGEHRAAPGLRLVRIKVLAMGETCNQVRMEAGKHRTLRRHASDPPDRRTSRELLLRAGDAGARE